MTVRDLIAELSEFPHDAIVRVAVTDVFDGSDRVTKQDVGTVKFEDDEVIVELG